MFVYKNNVHAITGENGTEFAEHQTMAKNLKTNFFLPKEIFFQNLQNKKVALRC